VGREILTLEHEAIGELDAFGGVGEIRSLREDELARV
jgi:hypothetical protein